MANYYASSRSNYFRVKDEQAFKDWLDTTNIEILATSEDDEGNTTYAIVPNAPDGEGWSLTMWEDDEGVELDEERDLIIELSGHLADGWVAILMEAGAEKLRYVSGFAIAVNNRGAIETVHLSDIYEKAQWLGGHLTPAEY